MPTSRIFCKIALHSTKHKKKKERGGLSVCLLWCDSRQRAHEPYTHANEPCIQLKSPIFYQNLERGRRLVCLPCAVYFSAIHLPRSPISLPKSRVYPQKGSIYRSWGVSCASSGVTKQAIHPQKSPVYRENALYPGQGLARVPSST